MSAPKPIGLRGYFFVWIGLIAFVALTVASAYLRMGAANLIVSILIAIAKAAIVLIFCMGLRRETATIGLFAAAGFFWVTLMIGLSLGDYWTR